MKKIYDHTACKRKELWFQYVVSPIIGYKDFGSKAAHNSQCFLTLGGVSPSTINTFTDFPVHQVAFFPVGLDGAQPAARPLNIPIQHAAC